jgi:hypothetical protein
VSYAVQLKVDGEWVDAGDYPNTASTTVTHARERTKYDGVPARAVIRETDEVLAVYEPAGDWKYTNRVRKVA